MAEHPSAALLRRFFEEVVRPDNTAALSSLMSADVVWHLPGRHSTAGDHVGRDAVFAAMAKFAGIRIEVHDLLGSGEHAVALLRARGERQGRRYDAREVDIFHIRDGQIAEFWSFSEDQRLTDAFWSD